MGAFQPGMLVALQSGFVGIVRGDYMYDPPSVPTAAHRRVKVEVRQGLITDVAEAAIVGRVTYKAAHLRAVSHT